MFLRACARRAAATASIATSWSVSQSNERLVSSDELASHDERLVSSDELASHDFTPVAEGGSGRLWVSYKRGVYDVTDWAAQHPGGLANLKMAAGGPSAPTGRTGPCVQDPSAALPVLEKYRVGRLAEDEEDDDDDPYADEPDRAARIAAGLRPLKAGAGGKATGPFEAECDVPGLSFLTPADIFYVRNHAPAPPEDAPAFASASPAAPASASRVGALRRGDFGPVVSLPVTVQCSGNRLREAGAAIGGVNGWTGRGSGYGLISTATWEGVRLADVLEATGALAGSGGDWHVEATGRDGYANSVPLRDVASNDALLAFGMNGGPLPRDHGAPLRLVLPGCVGARQVKWLDGVRLLPERSEAPWQRSFYTFPDGSPVRHWPVCSAATAYDPATRELRGFAYAGDGRGVARVDVSFDGGETWTAAALEPPAVRDGAGPGGSGARRRRGTRQRWTAPCARRTSRASRSPRAARRIAHMPKGYLFNAVHRVAFDAAEPVHCNRLN
ncbi:sulfite oxidase [Aureococcus anophagefferens]|nr:sulfite oxidase [Aureococcus anophagefferens]